METSDARKRREQSEWEQIFEDVSNHSPEDHLNYWVDLWKMTAHNAMVLSDEKRALEIRAQKAEEILQRCNRVAEGWITNEYEDWGGDQIRGCGMALQAVLRGIET